MMTGVLLVVFVAVIGGLVSGLALKVWQAGQRRRLKRAMKAKFGAGTAAEAGAVKAKAVRMSARGSSREVQLTTLPFANPMHAGAGSASADGEGDNDAMRLRSISLLPSAASGATRNPLFHRNTVGAVVSASRKHPRRVGSGLRAPRGGRKRTSVLGRRRSVLATFTGLDDDDAGEPDDDDEEEPR